tara:strand:- start:3227 stop:3478 length:252 start_codon:yes stop_codon:yes gene_type:complete
MFLLDTIKSTKGWYIIGKNNCVQCDVVQDELFDRDMEYTKIMMEDCDQDDILHLKNNFNFTSYPVIFNDGIYIGGVAEFVSLL